MIEASENSSDEVSRWRALAGRQREALERIAEEREFIDHGGSVRPLTDAELANLLADSDGAAALAEMRQFRASRDTLIDEVDQARLERDCESSCLAMTVARLGGMVEGAPTSRINFLQRIDELREIERNSFHVPLKAWSERNGEISWLCRCGAHNKHLQLLVGFKAAEFKCNFASAIDKLPTLEELHRDSVLVTDIEDAVE